MMRQIHRILFSVCLCLAAAHVAAEAGPAQDVPTLPVPQWCDAAQVRAPDAPTASGFSSPVAALKVRPLRQGQRIGATIDLARTAGVVWSVSWDEGNRWIDAASLENYQSTIAQASLQQFTASVPTTASSKSRLFVRARVTLADGSVHSMCGLASERTTFDRVTSVFVSQTHSDATGTANKRGLQ